MAQRSPPAERRPHIRLKGLLAPAAVTSVGGILYAIIPIFGSTAIRVRIKTSGNGGTLDLIFAGPDIDPAFAGAFASIPGTLYTTGPNPAQVVVSAGTEAMIESTVLRGESYAIVKFTGTVGAGAIVYCDVSQC